jgi:hypothetical protein
MTKMVTGMMIGSMNAPMILTRNTPDVVVAESQMWTLMEMEPRIARTAALLILIKLNLESAVVAYQIHVPNPYYSY